MTSGHTRVVAAALAILLLGIPAAARAQSRFQNMGESPHKGYYLDIEGETGKVILTPRSSGSGTRWQLSKTGDAFHLQNLAATQTRGWYLDIDGSGQLILSRQVFSGTRWRVTREDGYYRFQNLGNSRFQGWYLDVQGESGQLALTQNPRASGTRWQRTSVNEPTETPTAPNSPVRMEYRSFQNDSLIRYAWLSGKVAFLTVRNDWDPAVMAKLGATFDRIHDFYRQATGREPAALSLYQGRLTIAEVEKTCGAGCGYLGQTGIELMPDCFRTLYDGVAERNEYDQALPYEFGRNFWFYSPQLAYHKDAEGASIVTGYAVLMRLLGLRAAGANLGPFGGHSGPEFTREVERLVDLYTADAALSWENTLKVGRGPANPMGLGGTDLFASFCLRLARDYGGMDFIARLWQQAGRRPAANSTQEAIDNFVVAASLAAGRDLTSLFVDTWRWPVSDSVKREIRRR